VCTQGGEVAGKSLKTVAQQLAGLNAGLIAIWPDNDHQGRKFAASLHAACQSADVRAVVIEPLKIRADAPDKWDIADYVAETDKGEGIEAIQKVLNDAAVEDRRQLRSQPASQLPNNVVSHPARFNSDTIRTQLTELSRQRLNDGELEIKLTQIAVEQGQTPQQIRRIYLTIEGEQEQTAATSDAAGALSELYDIRGSSLPIEAGLYGDGGDLAQKLRQTAEAMPTAPEFLATTLIPVLGSRIGTSSRLVISKTAGYTQSPIFRTMVIARTGRKKSPSQKPIITALTTLEDIHNTTYQQDLEQYERDLNQWEGLSKQDKADAPKPKPPKRKRYFSTDDTLAKRVEIHSENPRGLLLYREEGSAFFTERGRFHKGKGDGGELEADLSEFDGGPISRDRKGDGSLFLARTGISRTGATHFETAKRLMASHDDPMGEFSRWLFCAADAPPSYLDLSKDVGDIGLTKALINLIQQLDGLPGRDYLLSHEAKLAFMGYQHDLTDRAIATDHPGLQAAYPKFETYFGRFILLLHIVNAVLAGQQPAATVADHTVEIARQWTEYYIGQFKLLMAVNSPQQGMTGDILRLHQYLERRPERTIRQIVQARLFDCDSDKSKGKTAHIRNLLEMLVEQGWATLNNAAFSAAQPAQGATAPTATAPSPPSPRPMRPPATVGDQLKTDDSVEISAPAGASNAPPPETVGLVTSVEQTPDGPRYAIAVPQPSGIPQFYRDIPVEWMRKLPTERADAREVEHVA
ncbi:MAG: DUF3987 domain-containing protein, partial [Cyanobacteria bacterium P01_A01_bin.17]